METLWRKIWSQSNNDAVDPGTGLTGREKKLVQCTWAIVYKDPVASGTAIMSRLFECHPEYQSLFAAFKDVPRQELPSNKKFQAHSVSVVSALNNVIDALSDAALLEATLVPLGKRHGQRGITKEHFLHLKQVVLDVLRQALGTKFTAEAEEAWIKTIDAAYTNIFKGLST